MAWNLRKDRSQESGIRGQESEVKSQMSEVKGRNLGCADRNDISPAFNNESKETGTASQYQ